MAGMPGSGGSPGSLGSVGGDPSARSQGCRVDDLVQRGDAWEGRVVRDGRQQTVRIDPLTGQALAR